MVLIASEKCGNIGIRKDTSKLHLYTLIEESVINETILEMSISLRIGNATKEVLFF